MNCRITTSPTFVRSMKRLAKRYKSLKGDYVALLETLQNNPTEGVDLGNGLRKVRMAISSKNKGKSGGARVITYKIIKTEHTLELCLLDIYDKSEQANISDSRLRELMDEVSSDQLV